MARLRRSEASEASRLDALYRTLAAGAAATLQHGAATAERLLRQRIEAYFELEAPADAAGSAAGSAPITTGAGGVAAGDALIGAGSAAGAPTAAAAAAALPLPIKAADQGMAARVRAFLRVERTRLTAVGNRLGGRFVARVFHGLYSPAIKQDQWRRTEWWGRHSDVDFASLVAVAEEELEAWREQESREMR